MDAEDNHDMEEGTAESVDEFHLKEKLYSGFIVSLKNDYGFIQPDDKLPEPYIRQQVFFAFSDIKKKIQPNCNNKVEFLLNSKCDPDRTSAKTVWIKGSQAGHDGSKTKEDTKNVSTKDKRFAELYEGRVVKIIQNEENPTGIGFIRPFECLPEAYEQKDVYFHVKNVQSGGLELVEGDILEFSLGVKNKVKPLAFKLKLVECKVRSSECIENYMWQHTSKLFSRNDTSLSNDGLLGLLTCTAVWKCIGNTLNTTSSNKCMDILVLLILKLEKESRGLFENFRKCIEDLLSTPLFNPWKGQFKEHVKNISLRGETNNLLEIQKLLLLIMKYVPQKTRTVVSLIKPTISENSPGENFLYNILKQASKSTNSCVEDMEWDELPLVPSITEMLHGILESNISIQPAKPKGAYDSVQHYIDTYFRLLRADCFEALTKGIKSLLKGKLDPRDMHVYHDIHLAGILITQNESGLSLGLKVTPQKQIKNWEHSSNLIFGNLVCISPSGNFRDVIWATVVDRSLLKNKQIVLVDLCTECNNVSDPEAVRLLEVSGGEGLMAESPAYYRAYQPVLKALQRINPEKLPFQPELVEGKMSRLPTFISNEATVNGRIVYEDFSKATDVMALCFDEFGSEKTTLDVSQQAAIKQALRNRVAIIQGPPGTGKTFIGIKIVQLLESLQPTPRLPILVMTYKNHALDEFLKELVDLFPGKVGRVGGRSQEPGLEGCNINELKRNRRMPESLFKEIKEYKDQIENLKPKVIETLHDLCSSKRLSLKALRKFLSSKQIQLLLVGCDWTSVNIPSLQQVDKDGFQIASGKKDKAKQLLMSNKEAADILESLQIDAEDYLSSNYDPNNDMWKHVNAMVKEALKKWLPGQDIFRSVMTSKFGKIELTNITSASPGPAVDEDDERDAEEMEKERLSASNSRFKSKEDILKEMVMLSEMNKGLIWMPELAANSKSLIRDLPVGYLMSVENLWELPMKERVLYIQAVLFNSFEEKGIEFERLLKEYQKLCTAKNEIENQYKVNILEEMTMVGMTITGASINQQLLSQLRPQIIVVEEAAEVLEPQLLATMGDWCNQLILIGDHKQLRPPVESYTLAKDFHFDVSMMERLINNKLDHSSLVMQNRMRLEFADLLLDIYPKLQNNMSRVSKNQSPLCIASSMYFWTHSSPEISARSYSNEEEAKRAVRLALFLIQQGYEPKQITILGAYLGQVRLLRQKIKFAETEHKPIFKIHQDSNDTNDADSKEINKVKIQTIDNYQGDENEIVIVSLVRSNDRNKVGFLNTLNRRCVAQSRAKCGMYFIGNRATLSGSPHWIKIINGMALKGNVGEALVLQCPRHTYSQLIVHNADDITLGSFCKVICNKQMRCGIHYCKKSCQPNHSHLFCYEKVSFAFKSCGHQGQRQCMDQEEKMMCKQLIPIEFQPCKHTGTKLCYKKLEDVHCKENCTKVLSCSHPCSKLCSEPCDKRDTCKECARIKQVEEERRRKAEEEMKNLKKQEIQQQIDEMTKQDIDNGLYIKELKPHGHTASEYYEVEDLVKKYIQPGHNWYPKVTKIHKVTNNQLKLKWLAARKRMFNPLYVAHKFHGTSTVAVQAIISKGFLLPERNRNNMFGQGIYFATDSSKSAQEMYTKGSNTLLLCSVLLGKTLTVTSAEKDMNYNKLRRKCYDSLYAKRGTRETGGVKYDEYVVYHPDQALPEYVIHYDKLSLKDIPRSFDQYQDMAIQQQKMMTYIIKSKREMNPDDVLDTHFRVAESQFLRLINSRHYGSTTAAVKSVEYVVNPPLVQKFNKRADDFERKYKGSDEAGYILAFHGTKMENIENIVKTNFDISRLASNTGNRGAYGAGIYFSEFPSVSLGYAGIKSLLLCKVLPGRSYDVSKPMVGAPLQPGYDSHRKGKDSEGRGHELVIYDADQILPCYIINIQ